MAHAEILPPKLLLCEVERGGDVPTLGITIVAPGVSDSTVLFDGIEHAATNAEDVIVKSVEVPSESGGAPRAMTREGSTRARRAWMRAVLSIRRLASGVC